ncbi:MAG: terminase large subunit domain-containing protein [Planctomycetota bacterium]
MKITIPVPNFTDHIHKWQKAAWNHFYKNLDVIKHTVMVWHRRARKTTYEINKLITEASTVPNSTYAYVGPTFRQAKETVWRDPMMLKRYLPRDILSKDFNESELYGEFKNGSILHIGGADNPDRWRGLSCRGWVLDEYAFMRNGEQLLEEIIEPIIRENGGWVDLPFTPKGRNHGYRAWQKAKQKKTWAGFLLPADKSLLLTKQELREIENDLPARIYDQEYLCRFLEAGGGIIPNPRRCVQGMLRDPQKRARYVIGADLGKHEDFTVLTALNRETYHVDGWQRFNRIDWGFQKERIARMAVRFNNALVCLDSTGLGDPITDDLKRMRISVAPYQFGGLRSGNTSKAKRRLVEKLIVAIEGRHVTYPDIEQLVNELEDFDIDEHGRYGAPSGCHDDCVISLALAVEGAGGGVFRKPLTEKKIKQRRRTNQRRFAAMANQGYRRD